MDGKTVILHSDEFDQLAQLLGQAQNLVDNAQAFEQGGSNDKAAAGVDPLTFNNVTVIKAEA